MKFVITTERLSNKKKERKFKFEVKKFADEGDQQNLSINKFHNK